MTRKTLDKRCGEPLLTDDEFVTLIEQEYESSGLPMDELAAKRVWTKLQDAKIPDRQEIRANSRGVWFGMAMVALAILFAKTPTLENMENSYEGVKGVPSNISLLDVRAVLVGGEDRIDPDRPVKIGEAAYFSVRLNNPAYVAVLHEQRDGALQLKFLSGEVTAHEEAIVTQMGQAYGYRFEIAGTETFCMVAGANSQDLARKLETIENSSTEKKCLQIRVTE